MGYDIIRLTVSDWPALEHAFRLSGYRFYWSELDAEGEIPQGRLPYVAEYEGPLNNLPARRDPEANDLYGRLREQLPEGVRTECDGVFSRCFWTADAGALASGVAGPLCELTPADRLWNALRPETVASTSERMKQLPWDSLERAYGRMRPLEWTRYLRDYESFQHHVRNHEVALDFAAERGLGFIGLVSA